MAGTAKKAAAKKVAASGPSGVPVEGDPEVEGGQDAPAEDAPAEGNSDGDAAAAEGEGDGAPAADADDATEDSEGGGGPGLSNIYATAPELDPDAEAPEVAQVGDTGVDASWYDEISDTMVQFNRTVEEEFRHDGAKRTSHRQVFVRGQVVPKSQVESYNANLQPLNG